MEEVGLIKLKSALVECGKHLKRLDRIVGILSPDFPLKRLPDDSDEVWIEHCDQFIYRFSKLQDAVGLRLIPSLYMLLEDADTAVPFIDMLNRLEKLGVLPSAERWHYFRVLRNSFAHEYPEKEDDSLAALNSLFLNWDEFKGIYKNLESESLKRLPDFA